MRVTNRAVPTPPITCCTVLRIADPWEYRSGCNAPRPALKSGVKVKASPVNSSTCMMGIMNVGVSVPSTAGHHPERNADDDCANRQQRSWADAVVQAPDDGRQETHGEPTGQQEQTGGEGAQTKHGLHVDREHDQAAEEHQAGERDQHNGVGEVRGGERCAGPGAG